MPRVSVVMSVFNGEPYLREAIDSVLNQTFTDLEFIIVEDGSTDRSAEILKEYVEQDSRIRVVRNTSNLGLIHSLNRGLQLANGEYIARQDADDISLPERLASQVRFLDEHPGVGVVGTWITNVDEDGRQTVWQTPVSDPLIRWSLLFSTSIAHASVMMRSCLLHGDAPFRPEMLHAEDYDLWSRLSKKTQLANLPARLYLRRMHQARISVRYHKKQEETVKAVMYDNITRLLGADLGDRLVARLRDVYHGKLLDTRAELRAVVDLIMKLYRAYIMQNRPDIHATGCMEVAHDAARLLTRAGLKHIRRWPTEAIGILWKAIRLSQWVPLNICITEALTFLSK